MPNKNTAPVPAEVSPLRVYHCTVDNEIGRPWLIQAYTPREAAILCLADAVAICKGLEASGAATVYVSEMGMRTTPGVVRGADSNAALRFRARSRDGRLAIVGKEF